MVAVPEGSGRALPVKVPMPFTTPPLTGEVMATVGTPLEVVKVFGVEAARRPLLSRVNKVMVYVPFAHAVVSTANETAPDAGVHT
ncbi:unannotated protein [freshwater metagenome]|uniref:Unannotated protein n=1 Tax=freshwater metagenome TaxID=449393 RepID=A0A6J7VF30_9ZZZZ